MLRPKTIGGNKLETWWLGPANVIQRVGLSNYKVIHKPGETWDEHIDSMKPYIEDDLIGTGVPLYFHKGTTKSSVLNDNINEKLQITAHR